jgi:hypothetical protein
VCMKDRKSSKKYPRGPSKGINYWSWWISAIQKKSWRQRSDSRSMNSWTLRK